MELPSKEYLSARRYTTWQIIWTYWQSTRRFPMYVYYLILFMMVAAFAGSVFVYHYWHSYFYTLPPVVVRQHLVQSVIGIVLLLGFFYALLGACRFIFAIAILMTVTLVGFDLVFNLWMKYFYDALQDYNKVAAYDLLKVFFGLATFYVIIAVYRYYLSSLFGLHWRRWLTDQFVGRWLQKRTYYLLENFDESTDNPDQRIQEDVASIVSYTTDLVLGVISAVTTFLVFIYVLWLLSGVFVLSLGKYGTYHVPGYLVWVGALYAIIGTILTIKIGKPLVGLNFEQQRREATFRYAAVDLRTHAENVALYRGESQQRNILQRLFDRVLENYYLIILRQKMLLWFTAGYNQLSVVLPLLVALPNYFDKIFLLGGLMQSLQAFNRVQDSLSFLINSYTTIANWQAIAQRLTTFVNHMSEAEEKALAENKLISSRGDGSNILSKDMSIFTPRGEVLLTGINENFVHGSHYLIEGESGTGKSTYIRALSGIWPYASGEVVFPKENLVMYVPQRPYMPIGTLMEAILFPDKHNPKMENQVEALLASLRLEHLIPRLNETAAWSDQLSPGEQQRIAFSRVLLHKPDWVFLDESTSMLDAANEERMYQLLKTELPNCSIVSVGHRTTLKHHHDHVIDMTKYRATNPTAV